MAVPANNSANDAAAMIPNFVKLKLGVLIGSPFEFADNAALRCYLRSRTLPHGGAVLRVNSAHRFQVERETFIEIEIVQPAILLRDTVRRANVGVKRLLMNALAGGGRSVSWQYW